MVGFIATYVDVVATLEENDFKLKPPAEGECLTSVTSMRAWFAWHDRWLLGNKT